MSCVVEIIRCRHLVWRTTPLKSIAENRVQDIAPQIQHKSYGTDREKNTRKLAVQLQVEHWKTLCLLVRTSVRQAAMRAWLRLSAKHLKGVSLMACLIADNSQT